MMHTLPHAGRPKCSLLILAGCQQALWRWHFDATSTSEI